MVFLAHRLHSGFYSKGTFSVRLSFVNLWKAATSCHLILPIFPSLLRFPFITHHPHTSYSIIYLVYCLFPCLLIVLSSQIRFSILLEHLGFQLEITFRVSLATRVDWLYEKDFFKGMCVIEMCETSLVIFIKKFAQNSLFPSGWLELENQLLRKVKTAPLAWDPEWPHGTKAVSLLRAITPEKQTLTF